MFERRLRVFLCIVFVVGLGLLARAAQLQIWAHGEWQEEASRLGHRAHLVETTRGTILDVKGHEIALDEPCIDACVQYGAISRDPAWIRELALNRMSRAQPGVYRRSGEQARVKMLAAAEAQVHADIDGLWLALAAESKQRPEEMEEIRQSIAQRAQMRERYLQYHKFRSAHAATTEASRPAPWYQRLLAFGTSERPNIDTFAPRTDDLDQAHIVVHNVSSDTYTRLAKEIDSYPGLVLRQGAVRRYPFGKAGAHLLGHLGIVQDKDLQSPRNENAGDLREYQAHDLVGRGGLEQLAEPALRGTRGKIEYPAGRRDEIVAETRAIPGATVRTTIDIELQAQIQSFFEHAKVTSNLPDDDRTIEIPMHGACVVLDIPTGEVRALASYPDFDPNRLLEDYERLATDYLNVPLMNRATHAQLEPGSTVKPLVGLGAITQGDWSTTQGIECIGYLVINGKKQANGKCWTAAFLNDPKVNGNIAHHWFPAPVVPTFGNRPGHLVFADAIERSCNVYFETLADMLGADGLNHWFDRFGLGHETGLGISEARGRIPGPGDRFPRSLVWFSGIGQARVLATPIQMANAVATIARDGIWMKPKLIAGDVPLSPAPLRNGRILPDRIDLKLAPDALAAAKDGMRRVVNNFAGGTGIKAHMADIVMAGKTGTAQAHELYELDERGKPRIDPQTGRRIPMTPATWDHPTQTPWYRGWGEDGSKLNHAWFVAFAPADRPKIAIAVMVEYGGSGGTAAGTIARQTLTACAEHGYLAFNRSGVASAASEGP